MRLGLKLNARGFLFQTKRKPERGFKAAVIPKMLKIP
jgi:hypothetical protein